MLHSTNDLEAYMLPCLNKKFFGAECMGCGLQRSALLVLKGEFIEAFFMYPAIYPLMLLFAIVAFNFFKPSKLLDRLTIVFAISSAVVMVGSFFIKNYIN